MLICVLTASCRSGKETVRETAHTGRESVEIRTVHDTVRDSVQTAVERVIRDSVIVRTKGDTVYVDRWHVRANSDAAVRYRDRMVIKTDTFTIRDTVSVTKTEAAKPAKGRKTVWRYIIAILFALLMLVPLAGLIRNGFPND